MGVGGAGMSKRSDELFSTETSCPVWVPMDPDHDRSGLPVYFWHCFAARKSDALTRLLAFFDALAEIDTRARLPGTGRTGKLALLRRAGVRLVRAKIMLERDSLLDPVTSNAFADFLDERGEHRAAALLREAFPLVDAAGNNGVPA